MEYNFHEDLCVICKEDFEEEAPVTVTRKGIATLITHCVKQNQSDLNTYLIQRASTTPVAKVLVHKECRRKFTHPSRKLEKDDDQAAVPDAKKLRSSFQPFNWKEDCVLCCQPAVDRRHPDRKQVRTVTTLPIRNTILETCDSRGDTWAAEVRTRLHGCIDLVAAEAVYHGDCLSRFSQQKDLKTPSITNKVVGRPVDQQMMKWFEMLCHWLESEGDAELYTLGEVHDKMKELSGESEVYTIKRLKQKLEEHYKECIFFAEVGGRSNVVCFRNMAKHIINDKWYADKKANIEDESERIVTAAAKIIKAEIREREYEHDIYPTKSDISDIERNKQWVPDHLLKLLAIIIPSELRQSSIGQCILQSARPRSVIAPIPFGLGVELDHVFGSKWLITELYKLGFASSYDEVTTYKQCIIQTESPESVLAEYFPGTFTQWVADNVDHNVGTLDGQNTFHGMGIIAVSTPEGSVPLVSPSRVIQRKKRSKVNDVVKDKGVPIIQYISPHEKGLNSLIYKPILHLQAPHIIPSTVYFDLLWHSGWHFSTPTRPRPSWSGFMQHVFSDSLHPTPKSEVLFLPIIDLNPSDQCCIYSTLLYVQCQAEKLSIPTPCITFDQPLWVKAVDIIKDKSMNIVCRLGGFHTMMSFMGSIGSMMKGSGLEEVLETVYGPNAVTHMMSGKAVARALRGHFLVEAALMNKLMAEVLPANQAEDESSRSQNSDATSIANYQASSSGVNIVEIEKDQHPLPESSAITVSTGSVTPDREMESDEEMETTPPATDQSCDVHVENKLDINEKIKIRDLYCGVKDKVIPCDNVAESQELQKLDRCLIELQTALVDRSPTAALWFQYIEYVQTLKLFIRAERIGNWGMHLLAVGKMMNLFAATGHINYAKSSRLYLQMMLMLPNEHPWLHQCFMEQGFHTVRRSSRFWAGLWTDLTIEQALMRSIKSRGGLTRERGVTETVQLQWVYSMHECAAVHNAMTSLTNVKHTASEQHKEWGESRSKRDYEDLKHIEEWFDHHEPFDMNEPRLRSLSSGLTASEGDGINCHKTEEIGMAIQKQLDNVKVAEASIKRSNKVKSLDQLLPAVKVDKQKLHINPDILFSRLIVIVQREDDMAPYFQYELSPIPTSLFKDNAMRKAEKSQLAKALQSGVEPCQLKQQLVYVLDGGALLHRVKWIKGKGTSYKDVAMQYVDYVASWYGKCCIVFDGYEGPSIKDHEHQRRVGKSCADIQLSETMKAHHDQQSFLSNGKNKTSFILLLARRLESAGHIVHISSGDADTLIVASALHFAEQGHDVSVEADDTDIIVLLMYHWKPNMADIYFRPKPTKKKELLAWKVKDLVNKAGEIVTSNLLFIHAWCGCDTTSATFGHGKTNLLKKMKQSEELQQISSVISNPQATEEEVGNAGIRLFVILYGGREEDTLGGLRFAKFMAMVSSCKGELKPWKLPPTDRAAHFHSLRVHLQVMVWSELKDTGFDPEQWGWNLTGLVLTPVMTDRDAAPQSLLQFVRCKCKLSSRNPCGNNGCSCRKNGLKCVTACGDCRGDNCKNAEELILADDDEY